MIHLPNAISLGRLLAVPFVVLLLLRNMMEAAFWVFIVASLSDAIDGYLARKFNFRTSVGLYLDPLADKILLAAIFVTLGALDHIPALLVWVVLLRDVFIFIGVVHLHTLNKKTSISPTFVSKANTLLQMFFLTLLLAKLAFNLAVSNFFLASLGYGVAVTTVLSWIGYGKRWFKALKK